MMRNYIDVISSTFIEQFSYYNRLPLSININQNQLGWQSDNYIVYSVILSYGCRIIKLLFKLSLSTKFYFDSINKNFWSWTKKIRRVMLREYTQNKFTKTLLVEDEDSQKIKISSIESRFADNFFFLGEILQSLVGDIQDKMIRVYDFQNDSYVHITSQDCQVPVSFLDGKENNFLLVKIKNQNVTELCSTNSIASVSSSEYGDFKSQNSSLKRERSKERVIFEVIQIVKKWREIHLSKNNLRKVSLQQAAKMVGLPKKSLDDYYYQLRLGEKYDFDFKLHLFQRIGVLRTYLKNLKENSRLDKTQKHPKRLKIIDEFDQLSAQFIPQRGTPYRNDMQYQNMSEQGLMKIEQQCQMNQQSKQADQISLKDHFYSQFQYMLNDKDPFLACDFNFKKKGIDQNDDLFF